MLATTTAELADTPELAQKTCEAYEATFDEGAQCEKGGKPPSTGLEAKREKGDAGEMQRSEALQCEKGGKPPSTGLAAKREKGEDAETQNNTYHTEAIPTSPEIRSLFESSSVRVYLFTG